MIYTDLTKKALKLCFDAHRDQTDKSDMPYVFHPFHLAEQMSDENTTVVALLHDVIEDTALTDGDLRQMGFPEQIVDALVLMTHDKKIPYMDYVLKIRKNPLARAVKLADLEHNSDSSRLSAVTEKDRKRLLKYMIATAILKDDAFDRSGGYYRKTIPLDFERYRFLSVFYTSDRSSHKVLKFSLDVEAACDSHFQFDGGDGEHVRELLDPQVSLPEALAEYLADHDEDDFASLLRAHGIGVEIYRYD